MRKGLPERQLKTMVIINSVIYFEIKYKSVGRFSNT